MRTWLSAGLPYLAVALLSASACSSPPYRKHAINVSPLHVPPDIEQRSEAFVGVGETMLFERSWRPTKSPRASVVIVHGLKDHSGRYNELATFLVGQGLAVYAFDLRGHGYSEGVREHVRSFDEYLGDLHIFLGRVRGREPGRPMFLLGHSMGGAIVALYALRKNPPIAGLVLSAPAVKHETTVMKRFGVNVGAIFAPKSQTLELDLDKFSRDKASVSELKRDPLVFQEKGTTRTGRELLRAMSELQTKMDQIDGPLLVLHGTADKITNPDGSRELESKAKSKDKTLKLYPGLYHDLFHEPERDEIAGDVASWLRKHADAVPAAPVPTINKGTTTSEKPSAL